MAQADRQVLVVLIAVQKYGLALRCSSPELKADHGIVLAACTEENHAPLEFF
jgi:hypothetical protein